MNKSTIKTVAALSLAAVFGTLSAFAQDGSMSSAKVFGGAKQFRTWSIGVNGGVITPVVLIGGTNDFNQWDANFGYGAYIKKQISHAFALKLEYTGGKVAGTFVPADNGLTSGANFDTQINYALALKGQVDLTSLFLKRDSKVALFVQAGYGITGYDPDGNTRDEQYIPVGAGLKFKLSDRIGLDLGYDMNFLDADNLDARWLNGTSKDKWSYGYAGLEFSLGSKAKPNLDWSNPVAMMYDELKDEELRKEVAALKSRVAATEGDIANIKKDTDGDGVSDVFDKEPNTPAGNVVDGAGRTIIFPEPKADTVATPKNTIQFDFNSDVIRPESQVAIDALASELKASGSKVLIEGFASAEGTEAYNMNLSKRRANSAKKALVKAGVSKSNLTTVGYGESRPVASNDTEEGRQKNRRVEFKMQ